MRPAFLVCDNKPETASVGRCECAMQALIRHGRLFGIDWHCGCTGVEDIPLAKAGAFSKSA